MLIEFNYVVKLIIVLTICVKLQILFPVREHFLSAQGVRRLARKQIVPLKNLRLNIVDLKKDFAPLVC